MALADTARLIASLELQDKFTGPAKRAEGAVGSLDRKMGTLGASGQKLGAGLSRAFSTIAKIGVGVAAGGIALLAVNIRKGVESLNELENVTVQTQTVIESTGGVAGQTAEDVRNLAEEFESLNATIDDKVIQNAENMLLTFTNVTEQAFEPALEAVLNINQAMGGGEEGLQGVAVRVGKALNDPIKGLSTLTRVGVTFSKQQADRIKQLQEEGDLYGAQTIILKELETEFGGQFAQAGNTAEGSMARLGDAVEDLQQRLAGPLLPAIDRVREKLTDFLGSKQAQGAAEDLGEAIAGIFTNRNIERGVAFLEDSLQDIRRLIKGGGEGGGFEKITASIGTIATTVGGLPWQAIGDAARLLGTGSKALLDAFLGLPPWVQTAVLTGWGLNKLTGGAIGGVAAELFKQVVGIRANTVIVQGNTVTGGPGGAGGGRGGIAGGLAIAAGVGLSAVAVERLIDFSEDTAANTRNMNQQLDTLPRRNTEELDESIGKVQDAIDVTNENIVGGFFGLTRPVLDRLEAEKAELVQQRAELVRGRTAALATGRETASRLKTGFADNGAKIARMHADTSGHLSQIRATEQSNNARLAAIQAKKTSFSINNTVNVNTEVEFSASAAAIQLRRVTQTTGNQQDFEFVN